MREYKLELLAPAWRELEMIADMHLSLVGAKSAEKITTQILDALECLKTSPYMGRACEERILAADEYRKLIVGKYPVTNCNKNALQLLVTEHNSYCCSSSKIFG